MALNRFEKDMKIIQALDDEPNDVGGMTATELKATFDEGGEAVKAFLNEVLLPALDAYIARTDNPHAVTKAQVGLGAADNTADADKPVSAAQSTAIATAKSEAISASASDAASKAATAKAEAIAASDTAGAAAAAVTQHNSADSGAHSALFAKKLDKTGGELTGPLTLSGTPSASLHAATKQYVDDVSAGVVLGQVPDHSITSGKLAVEVNDSINSKAPGVHAANHAVGGSDPLNPAQIGAATAANLAAHTGRTDNPHGVTAAQVGAISASDARELIANQKWTLLATYLTAGAFTFTVPAGYTKLGAYMIGGGGSGAACVSNNYYGSCSGGASGYGKNIVFNVTPGQQISGVVGIGGAAVNGRANGKAGGTTSFGGSTVAGGSGGSYAQSADSWEQIAPGADGGQGSDATKTGNVASLQRKLYGGASTQSVLGTSSNYGSLLARGGNNQSPKESQNAFDPSMVTLCAGGWATVGVVAQTMAATDLGHKGGDGSLTANNDTINAESGIGPGSGGGAKWQNYQTNMSCYSGAGAPGAVYIYGVKE